MKSFIFRDNRLLKLVILVLSGYLVGIELYTFWVEKPTHTSISTEYLQPRHYPDIAICPKQSWDMEALKNFGYNNVQDYLMGHIDENTISWGGKNSNMSIENIFDQLSLLKSTKDCPLFYGTLLDKDMNESRIEQKMQLTDFHSPFSKCCEAPFVDNVILTDFSFKVKNQNCNKN